MSAVIDRLPSMTLANLYRAWSKGTANTELMADLLRKEGYNVTGYEVQQAMKEIQSRYESGLPLPF